MGAQRERQKARWQSTHVAPFLSGWHDDDVQVNASAAVAAGRLALQRRAHRRGSNVRARSRRPLGLAEPEAPGAHSGRSPGLLSGV